MHFHPPSLLFPSCYSSRDTNGRQLGMRSFIVCGRGPSLQTGPSKGGLRSPTESPEPWAEQTGVTGPADIKVAGALPLHPAHTVPRCPLRPPEQPSLGHRYMGQWHRRVSVIKKREKAKLFEINLYSCWFNMLLKSFLCHFMVVFLFNDSKIVIK